MKTSLIVLALLGLTAAKHHNKNSKFLQIEDHNNDTDDIADDSTFVAVRDHENDTEDMPDGMDPTAVQERDQDGGWVTYMKNAGSQVH